METEASFHALLRRIYDRHAPTLVTMARGVHELRKKMVEEGRCTSAEFANLTESSREGGLIARVGPRRATARAAAAREPPFARPLSVHDFLDAFYMARVGIRVLIGQYLELHRLPHPPGYVGLINRCAPPLRMAQPFDWAACAR